MRSGEGGGIDDELEEEGGGEEEDGELVPPQRVEHRLHAFRKP